MQEKKYLSFSGPVEIAEEILLVFKAEGGRCLSRESGAWMEIPDKIEREKKYLSFSGPIEIAEEILLVFKAEGGQFLS